MAKGTKTKVTTETKKKVAPRDRASIVEDAADLNDVVLGVLKAGAGPAALADVVGAVMEDHGGRFVVARTLDRYRPRGGAKPLDATMLVARSLRRLRAAGLATLSDSRLWSAAKKAKKAAK